MNNTLVLFTCTNEKVLRERVVALALLLTSERVKDALGIDIAKIIVSGGLPNKNNESEAVRAINMIQKLVGKRIGELHIDIVIEEGASNTRESIEGIKSLLSGEDTYFLSSETHIPRLQENADKYNLNIAQSISSEKILQTKLSRKGRTHMYHVLFWILEKWGPYLYKISPKLILPLKKIANNSH